MWELIKSGSEFFGYVKNLAKDGSFYWTLANVTPSFDQDQQPVGFFSVRRTPDPDKVRRLEPLYQRMLVTEKRRFESFDTEASDTTLF